MKNKTANKPQSKIKDSAIDTAIKTYGFLFPTTAKGVKDFETIFGVTDMLLPADAQIFVPLKVDKSSKKANNRQIKKNEYIQYAQAARMQEAMEIPVEYRDVMMKDRNNAQKLLKNRKKK